MPALHISKIDIVNIKSIRSLTWAPKQDDLAGWHVVLGNNGSGKSTFLKAVALALIDPKYMQALRQNWNDWLRKGMPFGKIILDFKTIRDLDLSSKEGKSYSTLMRQILFKPDEKSATVDPITPNPSMSGPDRLFSAAYGPFRRFSGGDHESESLFERMPILARYLSVFDERVALSHCLKWLQELKFRTLEGDPDGILLKGIKGFINKSEFLPSGVQLKEVTSRGVVFRDPSNLEVNVEELSDGFRSVLSMTLELIRQMAIAFGPENVFCKSDPQKIAVSGVVLIDEIDAHLHPTWQKRIGAWFCRHFPKVQFIVTTHSPLICQSAETGSIFLLPRAGSDEEAHLVEGEQLKRLLYGNVLDAYGTEAFGPEGATTQSPSAREKRKRLAYLNNKELTSGLSQKEREEQEELRGTLPSTASRGNAFSGFRARLGEYVDRRAEGAGDEVLSHIVEGIIRAPHQTVWAEMKRQRKHFRELDGLFSKAPETNPFK